MKSIIKSILCAVLVPVVLISCGGGGSAATGTASVPYTGLTTPAAVTTTNAVALTEGTLISGQSGSSAGTNPLGVATSSQSTPALPSLAHTLNSVLPRIKLQPSSRPTTAIGIQQTDSGSDEGLYGGTFSYSVTYDNELGTFSGIFAFNNLDEGDGVLNGSTSISGQLNLDTPEPYDFSSVTMTFSSMTFVDGVDSLTMGGTITATTNASTSTFAMTMNFHDGNIQYRVVNLMMTVTSGANSDVISISGQFYHSAHGYISVTTPTPLNVATNAAYPTSGVMHIAGSENTAAHVTFNTTGFTIEVDADGVGGYESTSNCTWGITCPTPTPRPVPVPVPVPAPL